MNIKSIEIAIAILFFSTTTIAQSVDTIVTMRGKIAGYVKEITPDLIAYSNPNESVIYKIERGAISKIVFANGRVEKFSEMRRLVKINGAFDWPQVDIATTEYETKGLYKIDLISTKATGTTIYSSVTKVQERAINKLKMAAALIGGNLVYMKNLALEGNIQSQFGARTTRAQIIGTVYCSELLDENKFKETIHENKKYTITSKVGLRNNDADIHNIQTSKEVVEIKSFLIDKGFIYLTLSIEGKVSKKAYRVLSFSDALILVAYRNKSAYYNLVLSRQTP